MPPETPKQATGAAAEAQEARAAAAATAASVLQIPVLFMRMAFLWPEGQNCLKRVIARYVYPLFNLVLIFGGVGFIAVGDSDTYVKALTTAGDVAALIVLLAKLICLTRAGPQLQAMRRQLQHGFQVMEAMVEAEAREANSRCTARCRTISRRFAWFYVPLCVSAGGMIVSKAFATPDKRGISVNMPRFLMENNLTYWPLFVVSMGAVLAFFLYSVGYDTLFLSLCLHLSTKCDILKVMLRRAGQHTEKSQASMPQQALGGPVAVPVHRVRFHFEYWNDDGSTLEAGAPCGNRREVDDRLRTCALYHQKVITLRDATEHLFAGISLYQMAYILMALGIPALRLLNEKSFTLVDVTFVLFYAAWIFSQLLFYCWFADRLAAASQEVSVAAYAAMRPLEDGAKRAGLEAGLEAGLWADLGADLGAGRVCNLGKAGAATLQLITLRAQRPLHLTAGKFANLTLVLYLDIMRRSQSMYSYLIRMR